MFRLEHYLILFGFGIIVLLFLFGFHSELTVTQAKEDREIEELLISSCQTALADVECEESEIFANQGERNKVASLFFKSFALGYGCQLEDAYYYIPCLALIDNDGFYIISTKNISSFEGGVNHTISTQVMTGKQQWIESYSDTTGAYSVKYFLNDRLEVTKSDGTTYKGSYKDVGSKLYPTFNMMTDAQKNALALRFLCDNDAEYDLEKHRVITRLTEDQISFYINARNTYNNKKNAGYIFTMPVITDDTFARAMERPTILAFAQGIQYTIKTGYINVFALTASTLDDEDLYYEAVINEGVVPCYYYHKIGCTHAAVTNIDDVEKYTMRDCARDGFEPCPYCIK